MNNQETPKRKFLVMSASPHVKSNITTQNIMGDVIIALLPALVWSVYVFGPRVITITALSVLSSMFFEYAYRKLMHKNNTLSDLSAVVTGLLLAFSLPVSVPLWAPVLGAFFAIVIVKQLYGGIGKNVVNPALAARIFLFISFPTDLTTFTVPYKYLPAFSVDVTSLANDVVAGATPLVALKNSAVPEVSIYDTLFGSTAGCFGEISASLLILGGIYLVCRKVISLHIPLSFLATVALISLIFPPAAFTPFEYMLYQLLTGGLMLAAVFMATDYTTSPITNSGKIIYGVGCGLITVFIRLFGGYPEGVSFAILIMNLFVWFIDKATKPRHFGGEK